MKAICENTFLYEITQGKKYSFEVASASLGVISIRGDDGIRRAYTKSLFTTIDEFRKEKIRKILKCL